MINAASTALAAGPYVQYVAAAAVALATWSAGAAFLLAAMLASDLANPLLKMAAGAALPAWLTDRPSGCGTGAGAGASAVSCSVLPMPGVCSDTRGMGFPSGHCQSMAVMAAFVTRRVCRTRAMPRARRAATIAAAWAAVALVAFQRVAVRCHSVPQAAAGLLVGAAWGWAAAGWAGQR